MPSTVLVADRPAGFIEDYRDFLASKGHKVFTAATLDEIENLLRKNSFEVAFISSNLLHNMDLQFLRNLRRRFSDCKFVLITPDFNAEIFLEAMHCSVFHECLLAPLNLPLLENVIQSLTQPVDEGTRIYIQPRNETLSKV